MKTATEEVNKFRRIWLDEFGEDITPEEAVAQIGKLDVLYALLTRPAPRAGLPGAKGAASDDAWLLDA